MSIANRIAGEIGVAVRQVESAIALLDEGATVPFIARYRKEVTGGLDDTQLRYLEERLVYLRELEERRAVVLNSIEEQGKLTPGLRTSIVAADTKLVWKSSTDPTCRSAERLGNSVVERDSVPELVRSSGEFRSLCPATAVCMTRFLDGEMPGASHG